VLYRRAELADTPETTALLRSLQQIDSTTSRMAALINDLLDVTRLHMSRPLDLLRRPVDLVQLTQRVVAEHQQTAEIHHLRVQAAVPNLVGSFDGRRIERVIANLLSNAVKYSPEGGTIEVELRRESDDDTEYAVLSIRDYGIGVPADDLPYLFERFHRGSNISPGMPGTGIGLSSVRQIAEQHGGSVTVESHEGEGATFTLRLPLSQMPHQE
jgi:signal transduction histidine kinase